MLRHLGGVGVFILAALDSSVLPTLGAVDALTIVLAARHPELWAPLRHVQHGRLATSLKMAVPLPISSVEKKRSISESGKQPSQKSRLTLTGFLPNRQ